MGDLWRFVDRSISQDMERFLVICGLLSLFLFSSCSLTARQKRPTDLEHEIQRLERYLLTHAQDGEVLRELGVLYLQSHQVDRAFEYLKQAHEQDSKDPETRYYYALVLESTNEQREALSIYGTYAEISRLSPYRRLMASRYRRLASTVIREEMRVRVADEAAFHQTSPWTVAVFPFIYQNDEDRFAPLGRGISELLAVDLNKIERLQVLERVRLQALLDELQLAQSDVMDPTSAPRMGRLLGAGRIVAGTYFVSAREIIRLDVASWKIDQDPSQTLRPSTDALQNLFVLEKDIVFKLLDEMAIEPTPEEHAAIEHIPTRSMEAFLAYCRGLMEEDAGRYEAAQQYYNEARTLDPDFSEASDLAFDLEPLGEVGDIGMPTPSAVDQSGLHSSYQPADLVQNRLQNLGTSVGSIHVPGADAREPAAEASNAGTSQLPPPPPPPNRGNR